MIKYTHKKRALCYLSNSLSTSFNLWVYTLLNSFSFPSYIPPFANLQQIYSLSLSVCNCCLVWQVEEMRRGVRFTVYLSTVLTWPKPASARWIWTANCCTRLPWSHRACLNFLSWSKHLTSCCVSHTVTGN